MTRDEMHTAFRVYGQQIGMQKMRNILPEEIDVFLNSAVVEKIRQVLGTNVVAQFPDKVSTQQNSISPINYVRTLVKSKSLTLSNNSVDCPSDIQIMYILGLTTGGHKARFIEPIDVENVKNDFCNAPSKEYPIFTFINNKFEVYGDTTTTSANVQYVEYPAKIGLDSDGLSISCNLPEYTHDEIVQLAVQKYFASLNNTQKVN